MTHALLKTLAATLVVAASTAAHAQLIVSEVAPYASGNTPFGVDWMELTNTGAAALTLSNWRMDDNSNAFASGVPLLGITTIGPGESVVFLECAAGCAAIAGFRSYWGAPVAGLQIGTYSGTGVGLANGGDAVNIWDSVGSLLARIDFSVSTVGRSFDNAAGLNNATIGMLSTVGVNGAFASVGSLTGVGGVDIGSPGRIAAPIPEPTTALLWLGGLAALAAVRRGRHTTLQAPTAPLP